MTVPPASGARPGAPAGLQAERRWLTDTLGDLAYATRLFRRHWLPSSIAVAGLGASMAVCGIVFSVVNAAIFKGYGMDDPASVVRVWLTRHQDTSSTLAFDKFVRLRDSAQQIALEAYLQDVAQLADRPDSDASSPVPVTLVSAGYFRTLGATSFRGRLFDAADHAPSAPAVAVVSHRFWTRRLGGAESAVGSTVWLSGSPFTVVGITDARFTGPSDTPPAFWTTIGGAGPSPSTGRTHVQVIGRLRAGVTPAQAGEELTALVRALASESGRPEPERGALAVPVRQRLNGGGSDDALTSALLVVAVVALALVLACVNVANLLLAAAAARGGEMTLRLALGASRLRLVRQMLTESLLLACVAGLMGVVLMLWGLPVLATAVRAPLMADVTPDARVYAFLLVVTLLAGVGCGFVPALRGTGTNLLRLPSSARRLEAPRRRRHMVRSFVLSGQTAASLLAMILAMLLGKAAVRAAAVDPGFDADRLFTVAPAFGRARYGDSEMAAYWEAARERAARVPGVERTALAFFPPYAGLSWVQVIRREERERTVLLNATTPDYFATIGVRLLRGRLYTADDLRHNARVAVISSTLAKDYWHGEDPVGTSLGKVHEDHQGTTVIGIVSDAFTARLSEYQAAAVYRPLVPDGINTPMLVVRARDPAMVARVVLDTIRPVDPELRLSVGIVADALEDERQMPATGATMAGLAAALTAILSLVGLVGATLQQVGQRRREIGVRLAVGASSRDVLRLLLTNALRPVAFGLGAGLACALLGTRAIGSLIFGVSPTDPASIARALGVLTLAAVVAVLVPTLRASRTDPAVVLREP